MSSAGSRPWLLPHLHLQHLQGCWISPRSAAPPPDSQHHHHQSLSYLISSQNCCKISSFAFLPLSAGALHQRDIIHKLPGPLSNAKLVTATDSSAFITFKTKASLPGSFWLSLYLPLQPSSMFSLLQPQSYPLYLCPVSSSAWVVPLPLTDNPSSHFLVPPGEEIQVPGST